MKPRAEEAARVEAAVAKAVEYASRRGAEAAAGASLDDGTTVACRMQETETLEFHRSQELSVTVYKKGCKGSASTAELSDEAVGEAVDAALQIARFTSEDPCAGLAEKELLAQQIEDWDLFHPWELTPEQAIEKVLACEQAALDVDSAIVNSEGASLTSFTGTSAYANSNGFMASRSGTAYSQNCIVIARDDQGMERDYWYSSARRAQELEDDTSIGRKAGERTLARLSPRKPKTGKVPVVFSADMAKSLLGHLSSALAGGALYRRASFLLDRVGDRIFPDWFGLSENPHLKAGHRSSSYDAEGVATRASALVEDGVLQRYILGSYSARRLGLATTANAGGVRNLRVEHSELSLQDLFAQMGHGLYVTELIGQGVNSVTGDYSRGASGFWVENGEIVWPVSELTIAGNLNDMYKNLQAIANDVDTRGNVHTGSWLLGEMTVAGE